MNNDLNAPAWTMTKGELLDFISEAIRPALQKETIVKQVEYNDKHVYGISGIAKLLGCSKTMVYEYRKQGWIEPAIKQMGRKIVCDAPLALELFGKRK